VCSKYAGQIRMIVFIEEMGVIRKILKHLDLWDDKRKSMAAANSPQSAELQYTIKDAIFSADDMTVDQIYPEEAYF